MGWIKNPPRKDDPLAGDLSELIGKAKWKKMRFVFAPKDTTITLRLPEALVVSTKKIAKRKGVKYQALMRDAIANFVVREGE